MSTKLLTDGEFQATFAEPMRDVTQLGDARADIWSYVDAIPVSDVEGFSFESGVVEYVYRNGRGTFDLVHIPTDTPNVFLVVVVDLHKRVVRGHHLLNLNDKYGLPTPRPAN